MKTKLRLLSFLFIFMLASSVGASDTFSSECQSFQGNDPLFSTKICKNCMGQYCTKDSRPLHDNFCISPGVYWSGGLVCSFGISSSQDPAKAYDEALARALFSIYDSLGMLTVSGSIKTKKEKIKKIDFKAQKKIYTFVKSYNSLIERYGKGPIVIPYSTLDSGRYQSSLYFVRIITGEEVISKASSFQKLNLIDRHNF
ncbi:exported hypothetical protein [Candidatus Magnetomoraceae bacterium gMMP-15]